MAALKRCSFATVGTKFLSLINTPTLVRFLARDIYVLTEIKLVVNSYT